MSKVILVSTEVLWSPTTNAPYPGAVAAFDQIMTAGHEIVLVSNKAAPAWLATSFAGVGFEQFGFISNRQKKNSLERITAARAAKGTKRSDVLVIGATEADFLMAVNSRTLLLGAGWASSVHEKIKKYAVCFERTDSMPPVIQALEDKSPWHFTYRSEFLDILSLTSAGTNNETAPKMLALIAGLKSYLKDGKPRLKRGFMLHLLSSLCATEIFYDVDEWVYFPNSDSKNDRTETLFPFCDQARVLFGQRTKNPLFVRHAEAPKRHLGNENRTDPTSQLSTLHLHRDFKGKLKDKTVVVFDDYLTYGVSFGVSAALLKAAGAKKVICVAMGKFGNCARLYDIEVRDKDLYGPLRDYRIGENSALRGEIDPVAQLEFLNKFETFV